MTNKIIKKKIVNFGYVLHNKMVFLINVFQNYQNYLIINLSVLIFSMKIKNALVQKQILKKIKMNNLEILHKLL